MTDDLVVGGRYRLLHEAGRGGMGVVWRARDELLSRDVAVKVIGLPGAVGWVRADAYRGAIREARAAARIRHPNVAVVHDVSREDEVPAWIAMEFVPGCSLAQLIHEGTPLPLLDVAVIGRQVLAGLAGAHAVGVLHQDLKPGNVMITPDRRAVVTDFGIARIAGDPRQTQAGGIRGTPGFMPPERALGKEGTPASDLWALGATLFAAIREGRGPYERPGEAASLLAAVVHEELPDVSDAGPLADPIRALLSRDPLRRPGIRQAGRMLDEAIAALAAGHAAGVTITAPGRQAVAVPSLAQREGPGKHAVTPSRARRAWRRRTIAAAFAAVISGLAAAVSVLALGGAPASQLPVTAGVNTDKHLELFAVSQAGVLEHNWNLGSWSGWSPLTGTASTSASTSAGGYTGVPAAMMDSTGRMEVFARTTGGLLVRLWQSQPGYGGWSGPEQLGTDQVSSDPSVITRKDGKLTVFARLADGSLGEDSQLTVAPEPGWSGWEHLGGRLASQPVAVVNEDGDPEVFARAPDGNLEHDYYTGQWSGMTPLTTGPGFAGTPAVAVNRDGRLEVFARTGSGMLAHLWQEQPGSGPWSQISFLGSGLSSDPAAVLTGGALEVFTQLANGNLGYIRQQPSSPTGWSGWASMPGLNGSTPTTAGTAGRLDVFVHTASGGVADLRWTPSASWAETDLAGHT